MEYLFLIFFFSHLVFSYSIERKNGYRQYTNKHWRNVRSMQHPAFSMIMGSPMAFPGNTMQGGYMSESQTECITDDIVCPAYCLMEDEWGCKYCPCGPANGMSPPVVSNHKHEESHDCIGTILCMLSCKEGYKLGPRGKEDGCQPCTCEKKNETNAHEKNMNGKSNSSSSQATDSCTWPLCMNGQGPNNGPGAGASMTSLPVGGVKGGGSLPGVDCLGPSCSAKNGMRMMGNAIPPMPSSVPYRTPSIPHIPTTKRPLPAVHAHSSTKKTVSPMVPTKPPGRLYLMPVPTEAPARHCATLEYCMQNCQFGFQVENSRQECPNCNCILPSTPPPLLTTTRKPDFIAVMRVCPDAVHCMKSCTQGYTLTSSHTETCPICTCNTEPRVLLLCDRPLSCPSGCTVGYRGDESGCPVCKCVTPSETNIRKEVHTTMIDSALTCNPKFSCVDKCSLGYRTGDNGCPSCVCLEPVSGHLQRPSSVAQTHVQPSGLSCIGPECSAIHAVPQRLVLQCEQPFSCHYGCTVGYKCDREGCPICSCIAPSETTYKIEVQTIVVEKVLTCNANFSCPERCTFGFKTGPDGCPSCMCLQPVTVKFSSGDSQQQPVVTHIVRATEAPVDHLQRSNAIIQQYKPVMVQSSGVGCFGPECSAIHAVPQRLVLQCEQPLQCPYGCTVGYKCDREGCPICSCIAPSETTYKIQVQTIVVEKVLTCNRNFSCQERCTFGFKTGRDGCPSCTCLQPVTVNVNSEHHQQPIIAAMVRATEAPVAQLLVLQCEQPLQCPYGCTVGYKCDREGCPICSCIAPSETTYKIQVQTIVVQKMLKCDGKLSCPERCTFGLKTGRDGCPSCTCLQPVTERVNSEHFQQTIVAHRIRPTEGPTVHHQQMVPQTVTQMPLPDVIAPSGIGCLSPSCPSVQQLGQNGNTFLSAVGHNHMPQPGNVILPAASSQISSHTGKITGTVILHSGTIKKPYHNSDNTPKLETEKQSHTLHVTHHIEGSTTDPDTSSGLSAMEACPETVKCMLECQGTYRLAQRDENICPDCKCIHDVSGCIGPSCSAPGSHHETDDGSTPSPGECVAILHCVMTCNSGYDIGEYSSDGCPTCTCVQ